MKSITIKVPLSDGGRIQLQTADLGLVAKILALVHATEGSARAAKPRTSRAPRDKLPSFAHVGKLPDAAAAAAGTPGVEAPPVKRGRGRPRKDPAAAKPAREAKPRKAKLAKAEEAAARENAKIAAETKVRPSVAAMEASAPSALVVPTPAVEASLPNGAGSFDPDYIERLRQIKKFGELVGAVVEHTGLKTEAELFSHLTQLTPHVPALASIKDKLVGKLKLAMASLGLLDAADLGYA